MTRLKVQSVFFGTCGPKQIIPACYCAKRKVALAACQASARQLQRARLARSGGSGGHGGTGHEKSTDSGRGCRIAQKFKDFDGIASAYELLNLRPI